MRNSGIYIIRNKLNNKIYIGSSYDIIKRFKTHRESLNKNKHHNIKLQRAWIKYGKDSFEFELVFSCFDRDLMHFEQIFMTQMKPEYNIALFASAPMKGRKHSVETLEKLCGRIPWNKDVPRTVEEKALMSMRKKEKNKNRSPEYWSNFAEIHKLTSSRYWLGKNLTQRTKDKISKSQRRRVKKLICKETNEIFECQLDAARKYKIRQGHISENLKGKRSHVRGYTFVYVKEQNET